LVLTLWEAAYLEWVVVVSIVCYSGLKNLEYKLSM
jgi:hypothetical protein